MVRVALAALLSTSLFSVPTLAKEVNVSGSTSVARVMDVLAEDYNNTHPDSYVAVQGIGSSAGITLVKKGVADVGMSSRYLTESEQDESLTVKPIAFDGLAVVVNKSNPIENVTREQLFDIYKGKITNWKQLGGNDQKIAVVTREASSGSRYSFESLMGLTKIINSRLVSDINPDNLVVNSNSMVKTIVNHNKQAIGFVSTGSVDSSIKAIQFEGVEASNKTIATGQYELSRPFLVLYNPDKVDEDSKSFIHYLNSSQAKSLIEEYGYTPIKK
ncbi:phosphate ABC transporter substrate-binding protein [Vibrio europaeus]|uniref:phosphate ABC transporter substrate-binding protein n=1 Tax=Vibrio europaeus TaxID=300876 RepID=UPI00148E1462|nr:phosphate ABC transporter substrate-binding protein [Vibrio europaeus]MDC5818469.1 phosphate ABC transporter substrate-binding protein [Vibrio europaeus]MDC5850122.1 phosphate ABC transporter substrate-binding protein [Vibrio europaeus]MDC5857088.1 phosphate ABC transporter substrate-binding protein [Vibrio europaeus]MDC5871508.1 phosphate ABC transporter substrate-binding protein [Vibrio europaeus]NOH22085.1 phosphate ABC transporter substrate-binding protein [Vibrio europaeus]